jgi:hypothetical protein
MVLLMLGLKVQAPTPLSSSCICLWVYCAGLAKDGVQILTPLTYKMESQLLYCKFSLVQIVIEQVIGMIKDWAAAQETLHLPTTCVEELYDFHHHVWTVVSVFVNMYHHL